MQYAKHIELVHGYAYKEIVAPEYHDVFIQELFYHQLRTAWAASGNQQSRANGNLQRIPTFIADGISNEFKDVIRDTHRTIFSLKGMNVHTEKGQQLKHVANLLENFGRHQSTAAEIALSTDTSRVSTNELELESDQEALQETITHLMKQYNVTDPMLVMDLQQKNAQLLFHFLHFVENNGALDTLGHLHVSFGHIQKMKTIIEHVVKAKDDKNDDPGIGQQREGWWKRRFIGSNKIEKIASEFFSLEPYLTLDRVLVQHMQKTDDFRYMLQDWQFANQLMFIRIHAHTQSSGMFRSRGKEYKHLDLYAFLPTYVYLTREARNLLQQLTNEDRLKNLINAIKMRGSKGGTAFVPSKVMTPEEQKMYDDIEEENLILQGLLYFMKQQLIESNGTNVFLLHLHNGQHKGEIENKTKQQMYLFGQWHRQYILYDLKHYISDANSSGLRSVQLSPDSIEHEERRIYNLLDDRMYESPSDMEKWEKAIRSAVTDRFEEQTTVHEEASRRDTREAKAKERRRKLEGDESRIFLKDDTSKDIDHESAIVLGQGAVNRKMKMLAFVRLIQKFVTEGRVGAPLTSDGVEYPTAGLMWLVFCELYTFTPAMYNHVLSMVHRRLRKCEDAAMLFSGGLFNDVLKPTTKSFSLHDRNLNYFVSVNSHAAGSSYAGREYLLQLKTPHHHGPSSPDSDIQSELSKWTSITNEPYNGSISTRMMLSMLIDHVGMLSRATSTVTDPLETELAEIQCLSWPQYLLKQKVSEWTTAENALHVSLTLNALFATNSAFRGMGIPLLSLCKTVGGTALSSTAGTLGGTGNLGLWLAKSVLSKAAVTAVSPIGIGMGIGALLATGGVTKIVKESLAIAEGPNHMNKLFTSAINATKYIASNATKSSGVESALNAVSSYMLCNTRILKVKTKFRLNNVFYMWEFDLAVDVVTGQILMYYGIDEKNVPKQVKHKTYAEAYQALNSKDNTRRRQSIVETVNAIKSHKLQSRNPHQRPNSRRRSSGRRARKSQRIRQPRYYGGHFLSKKNKHTAKCYDRRYSKKVT